MKSVIGLLFTLSCLTGVSAATQTTANQKGPTATLSGRVLLADKGMAGITVVLMAAETFNRPEPVAKAITVEGGQYRLTKVPAGPYTLSAFAPGHILTDGFTRGLSGKPISISEGEQADGIELSLIRGGAISGRLTNAEGHPLVEESIGLMRVGENGRQQMLYPPGFSNFRTDDRGIYRDLLEAHPCH